VAEKNQVFHEGFEGHEFEEHEGLMLVGHLSLSRLEEQGQMMELHLVLWGSQESH